MQTMDSSITKTQKRNLTDMQEKFLDVLFTEAQGNPREAASLAGYSDQIVIQKLFVISKKKLQSWRKPTYQRTLQKLLLG